MKPWTLLALALLLAPSAVATEEAEPGAGDAHAPGGGTVATVNGQPVSFEDLERRLQEAHNERSETQRGAPDIDRLMQRLIDDELLAQEAAALGIHEEAAIVGRVEAQRRKLCLDRLEYDEIESKIEITDEILREAFLREYATVSLHILTAADQETAGELLVRLQDGADFEELAREHSSDPYANRGGKMEKVERVDFPMGLAARAWSLPPGELAGPFRTRLGWSVIRVDEFGEADPERFEAVKRWLDGQQRFRQAERLRDALGRRLRESHEVSIDEEAVNAIGCEALPDGRLMPQVEDPTATVARVGKRSISADELGRALAERWKGVRNTEAALATRLVLLQQLIRNELLRAEAETRGYDKSPEMQRVLRAYEKELIVRRYVKDVIIPKVEVTDEQLKAYYDEHKQDFARPPRVHVGQITVEEEAEAERLAELLRQGTDLAWLARQHSKDRFRDAGGERGWLEPAPGVDSFQDELARAKPGDVLGPMGVPGNYVVLKVNAREDRDVRPLAEVEANIRSVVFAQNFRRFYDDYVARLRERSEIEIHEDVLASMRISGAPTEEPSESEGPHGH
jgi:peptidyl-prolyl cis-trans isomerase C